MFLDGALLGLDDGVDGVEELIDANLERVQVLEIDWSHLERGLVANAQHRLDLLLQVVEHAHLVLVEASGVLLALKGARQYGHEHAHEHEYDEYAEGAEEHGGRYGARVNDGKEGLVEQADHVGERGLHGCCNGREAGELFVEEDVEGLHERHEDDHEAEHKVEDLLEGARQHVGDHRYVLVELQYLEELERAEGGQYAEHDVEQIVPVGEQLQVDVLVLARLGHRRVRDGVERAHELVGGVQAIQVHAHGGEREGEHEPLDVAPEVLEVDAHAVPLEHAHLLDGEHDHDHDEHHVADGGERDAVLRAEYVERRDLDGRDDVARGQELEQEYAVGEQVDVHVVDGELDEDGARLPIDPAVRLQQAQVAEHLLERAVEQVDIAAAAVGGVRAHERVAAHLARLCVGEGVVGGRYAVRGVVGRVVLRPAPVVDVLVLA